MKDVENLLANNPEILNSNKMLSDNLNRASMQFDLIYNNKNSNSNILLTAYIETEIKNISKKYKSEASNVVVKFDRANDFFNINYTLKKENYILNYQTEYSFTKKNTYIKDLSLEYNSFNNDKNKSIFINFSNNVISMSQQDKDYNIIINFYLNEKKITIKNLEVKSHNYLYGKNNKISFFNDLFTENFSDFYDNIIKNKNMSKDFTDLMKIRYDLDFPELKNIGFKEAFLDNKILKESLNNKILRIFKI